MQRRDLLIDKAISAGCMLSIVCSHLDITYTTELIMDPVTSSYFSFDVMFALKSLAES